MRGIQSNSNGIGARVEIYGSWGKQIRDIRSGEGFRYMSTLNAHFGIGNAKIIDQIIIRWPSGIVDTYNNITPNQMINIVEGSTLDVIPYSTTKFTLYPNPAKEILNIKSKSGFTFTAAKVFDLNGRVISEPQIINNSITVQNLTSGNYIILLTDTSGKNYLQKFIKK